MAEYSPFKLHIQLAQCITPSMSYNDGDSFLQWQTSSREKLSQLLGMDKFVHCEPDTDIEYGRDCDGFREIRFTFSSEKGYRVPCHLLLPYSVYGKIPLVICLQGHSKGMHVSLGRTVYDNEKSDEGDRDFAIRAVRENCAALVIEQRCFGECGGTPDGPDCYSSAMTALMIGRTVIGERVWDIMRALDTVLNSYEMIDRRAVICLGNSGGGTATFYASCLDERIKISVPSCAVCTYGESIIAMRHCACNYIPHISEFFDMGDLAGLIAPRYFVMVSGRDDGIFPLHGAEASFETAKRLYRYAGVPDKAEWVIGNGGHRFYADGAWAVINRFIENIRSTEGCVH